MNVLTHPNARLSSPHVFVRFIHTDGKEHTFGSCVNDLTGDRLSGFDNAAPSVNDSIKWIKSVIRDINAKATVIEIVNTIK